MSKLEKLKIINSQQQAKNWEQRIFEGLTRNNVVFIKIACNWLEKKWISPIKYESEICKYVSQERREWCSDLEDLKRKVLQSIYKYPSVYYKATILYDEELRRYNLKYFENYRRYNHNNPSDFKGLPFADGSYLCGINRMYNFYVWWNNVRFVN